MGPVSSLQWNGDRRCELAVVGVWFGPDVRSKLRSKFKIPSIEDMADIGWSVSIGGYVGV